MINERKVHELVEPLTRTITVKWKMVNPCNEIVISSAELKSSMEKAASADRLLSMEALPWRRPHG